MKHLEFPEKFVSFSHSCHALSLVLCLVWGWRVQAQKVHPSLLPAYSSRVHVVFHVFFTTTHAVLLQPILDKNTTGQTSV